MTSIFVKRHFEAGVLFQNRLCEGMGCLACSSIRCGWLLSASEAFVSAATRFVDPTPLGRDYADIPIKIRE
jgi:hypothetical protein